MLKKALIPLLALCVATVSLTGCKDEGPDFDPRKTAKAMKPAKPVNVTFDVKAPPAAPAQKLAPKK